MSQRYPGVPDEIMRLLDDGEQDHVDYKEDRPKDLALKVAAAANLLALTRSSRPFAFLLGVEEQVDANGVRTGVVRGLRDRTTDLPLDLDEERLATVNAIVDRVTPAPHISVDEFNTSSDRPFLVVWVRPNGAPHRVGDRYVKRVGTATKHLEPAELLSMFVAARNRAFVDEIEDDNVFTRALIQIIETLDVVQGRITETSQDIAEAGEASSNLARRALDEALEEFDLESALATLQEIGAEVSEFSQDFSALAAQFYRTSPTMEEVWEALVRSRMDQWITVCRLHETGRLTDDEMNVAELLFKAFHWQEPDILDYGANRYEFSGWSPIHRGGEGPNDRSAAGTLDRACRAAVAAAHRGRQGGEWMSLEGSGERRSLADLLVSADLDIDPREISARGQSETAILVVDRQELCDAFIQAGAKVTEFPGGLLSMRMRDFRLEVRAHSTGVAALLLVPEPRDAALGHPTDALRQVRRKLIRRSGIQVVRCHPTQGGALFALAGQRPRKGAPSF